MKTVVSGKRTVEYVKPSKRELENELMDYLNTKGVHIDKDVWEETVDYILSFWDEQDYKPRDTYEAINDWYNDTKKFFPEMFGKGRKVASARYLRWIKNHRLIKSGKYEFHDKKLEKDIDDLRNRIDNMSGKDIAKGIKKTINKNRRPVKSSAGNLPSEVYYMVVQGAKMYYSTDYDKVADMVQKMNSKPGPRVYGPYTEDDPEEIQELYEVGYLSNSRRPVKSSQKGFHDVAEGTKYDDYHVDTTGMGILDVEYAIEAIEDRGNQAVLTVQTNDGAVQHTYFTLNDWKKYKDAKNANGTAVTDVWITEVNPTYTKVTNSRKNQKIKNSYNCNRSKRMIKSSRDEKTMQAYDTADYIYENIMNRGQMYDKWFINEPQYAQDAAYICVEHTDFSVRLWFEFTNTDFCYVTGYFTNGSSYDKQVIDSWSYGDFETALNDVKSYLDNFFEIGGGLDSLRQKLGE